MKNRAFTLVEVIVITVIIGILATIAFPFYQNIMESSKQKVCDTNLLAVKKSVELYTMEHDIVPGALSQIDDKYIEKAYASVMSGKGAWKTKLAYLLVEGPQWGLAYAGIYGLPRLRCPCNADQSKPSYGINIEVAGISSIAYQALPDSTVIVADAAGEVFNYGGSVGPKYDHDFTPVGTSDVKHSNSHKKYNYYAVEYYLRGITKNEVKGAYSTSGAFLLDYP
jgi:prepilin-type N-terminal cleavage/methylation domain-containing protein